MRQANRPQREQDEQALLPSIEPIARRLRAEAVVHEHWYQRQPSDDQDGAKDGVVGHATS
ncbi:MAG: hypothetical protein HYU37_21720 [Acidobacteria bacterium]|nr:hypothetical protein [Acidobacteriota bacterium]